MPMSLKLEILASGFGNTDINLLYKILPCTNLLDYHHLVPHSFSQQRTNDGQNLYPFDKFFHGLIHVFLYWDTGNLG